ncbi:MAG: hypothetical protein LBB05_02300 [Puniceicoccales bacterium]|nr:hypothetical protein [Puniceicoccales bacterium]
MSKVIGLLVSVICILGSRSIILATDVVPEEDTVPSHQEKPTLPPECLECQEPECQPFPPLDDSDEYFDEFSTDD